MSCLRTAVLAAGLVLAFAPVPAASGRVALYGLIDKVVFEPNEQAPERVQVWGTFAYGEINPASGATGMPASARRGFLYFSAPADAAMKRATLAEWRDLNAVAKTGQAVAFGLWGFLGYFADLDPAKVPPQAETKSVAGGRRASEGADADLHIRAATEPATTPTIYAPNTGVIKLAEQGSRTDVYRVLRSASADKAAPAGMRR
jgi:hypothetical protein